jgi:hypothetical protein
MPICHKWFLPLRFSVKNIVTNSSADVTTGRWIQFRFLAMKKNVSSSQLSDRLWDPPATYVVGTGGEAAGV